MQTNNLSIEARFGEAVTDGRRVLRMSQKQLVEALSTRGLALDASAISRIEKGVRAIRLSEATVIADALGFSLSDIERPRDPVDDFGRRQRSIDAALSASHNGSLELAEAVEEMTWLIDRHPEVLESVPSEAGQPSSAAEYVAWIERSWRENFVASSVGPFFESEELRRAALALLVTVARSSLEGADG